MQDFIKKLVNRRNLDSEPEAASEPETETEPEIPQIYTPKTLEDFLWVIKNTPFDVLSKKDRATIASAISFRDRKVSSIMLPKNKITFVFEHDFLGPLMLDRLYQSGYSHFPVLSSDGHHIVGVLHTDNLNSLEIRDTDRASAYIDKTVYYLREDYTLEQAMAAFLRTNSFFYVVINQTGQVVGLLTYKMLVTHLLGYEPTDDFDSDSNLAAVMKRNLSRIESNTTGGTQE
ncbi:CBS domain-containing protein [Candidatus Saccharibacteria bacterium]|nr:CBS domain-containing protein [Candidatus Saccharibacteria bacterium]